MNDQEFEQRLRAELEAGETPLDELTRARLRAARHQALDQLEHRPALWRWPAVAVAASVTLAALLFWQPGGDAEVVPAADAELIADLDLVLWLEDHDS